MMASSSQANMRFLPFLPSEHSVSSISPFKPFQIGHIKVLITLGNNMPMHSIRRNFESNGFMFDSPVWLRTLLQ